MNTEDFKEFIWHMGGELYRPMPWREDTRPYYVFLSEVMLQQTQVDRVLPKFESFIRTYPTVEGVAAAPLGDVLRLWTGLGYNRRAKYIWEAAKIITTQYGGVFPSDFRQLTSLPGVGANTAGALLAYSFNQPVVFIETNIRTVFFYHFFQNETDVSDGAVRGLVEETLDREHPREWYWALMDYGSFLKRKGAGANNKSRHYKKQPPLKGSIREVRGAIVRALAVNDMSEEGLKAVVGADERFEPALQGLLRDGLVTAEAPAARTKQKALVRLHLTR